MADPLEVELEDLALGDQVSDTRAGDFVLVECGTCGHNGSIADLPHRWMQLASTKNPEIT